MAPAVAKVHQQACLCATETPLSMAASHVMILTRANGGRGECADLLVNNKKKKHYISSSQLRADQMPGPPRRAS